MGKASAEIIPLTAGIRRRRRTANPSVTKALADAIETFEAQLGGRGALIAALSVTLQTEEIASMVSVLGDPQNDLKSLAQICAEYGYAPAEILHAYQSAMVGRSRLLSLKTVSEAAPAVVEDLARKSVPYSAICADCHGRGKVHRERLDPKTGERTPREEDCLTCAGVGSVRVEADRTAQDRILDMTGLLPKAGPGIAIGIQNNIPAPGASGGGFGGGTLEATQEAVSQILTEHRTQTHSKRLSLSNPETAVPQSGVVEADILPPSTGDPA